MKTLDYRFQFRGNIETHPKIILVDCDDRSIAKLGLWPWRRQIHASMIEKLNSFGAKVIGYDVLFANLSEAGEDSALSQATLSAGNVIYPAGTALSTDQKPDTILLVQSAEKSIINELSGTGEFYITSKALLPFPKLIENAAGLGHIASHRDNDGAIRRVPLLVHVKEGLLPAFSLSAVRSYFNVSKENLIIKPGKEILLKDAVFPDTKEKKNLRIPINKKGEMLINFAGRWAETFQHISFIDLYENNIPEKKLKELLENSLVFVSNSATGFDIKPVPVEKDFPGGGIHANIANSILNQKFITYPSFYIKILLLFLTGLVCALLIINRRWQYQIMITFLLLAGYLFISFFLFNSTGIALEIIKPVFIIFISSLGFALWFESMGRVKTATLTEEKENLETELTAINQNLDKKEDQIVAFNRELKELSKKVKETESRQDARIETLTRKLENELKAKKKLFQKKKELERKYQDLVASVPIKEELVANDLEPLMKECLEHGIITRHLIMLDLFQQLKKASETTISILLLGKSGTGKELFARAVHELSDRSEKPFVVADLTTIPDALVESELFGHVKGAFTGAISDKKGKFQSADDGTLFLDEIGEMKLELQSKLLRILQEGEFNRVGDARKIKVDVRIIAATNRDLKKEMEDKRFREDLFYRINGIAIQLPPLEERKEDIPLLTHHFIQKYSSEYNKKVTGISELAVKRLESQPWPGNIRELENVISRAVALSDTEIIQEKDLGFTTENTDNDRETVDSGQRTEGSGQRTEDSGQRTEDSGQRTEGSPNSGARLTYEEKEDESFLNILRENKFSIDKAKKILKIERGAVSGRFKGICFQVLSKCNYDAQKAANEIAANNGLQNEVENRINEYKNNLLNKIKSFQNANQAIEEILKKEKNTKKRYLIYIEDFIRKEMDY